MTFAEQIARLRVATVTGHLPPDLGRSLLEVLVDAAPVAERITARNALLREAAGRIGGSRWAKAHRLEREVRALAAGPLLRERAGIDDGVRVLVAQALEMAPAPRSVRQLLIILGP